MPASSSELPAATTTVTPELTVLLTAELTAVDLLPPRDMLRTDLATWLLATHWIPEITPELVPDPLASRTLTPTILTDLETP